MEIIEFDVGLVQSHYIVSEGYKRLKSSNSSRYLVPISLMHWLPAEVIRRNKKQTNKAICKLTKACTMCERNYCSMRSSGPSSVVVDLDLYKNEMSHCY